MTCCNGTGWRAKAAERTNGSVETLFVLCGCGTTPVARPAVCTAPRCGAVIDGRDFVCERHRFVLDADYAAEEWEVAADTVEKIADAFHALDMPIVVEALRNASETARTTALFYESERDRADRGRA